MNLHVLDCRLELSKPPDETPVLEIDNDRDVFVVSAPLSNGNARLESNGRLVHDGVVRPGMLRVISPGERVRLKRRKASGGITFEVTSDWFREIAATQSNRSGLDEVMLVQPVLQPDRHIERLRSSLLSVNDVDPTQRSLYIEGLSLTLISLVLNRQSNAGTAQRDGFTPSQLAMCVEYADSRIGTELCLEDWAAILDMPTSEFVRKFQKATRSTPYAWFLNWRIDRAKALLTDSARSIAAISLEVGFSSQSHFTEAFRLRAGLSPARWRKLHQSSFTP